MTARKKSGLQGIHLSVFHINGIQFQIIATSRKRFQETEEVQALTIMGIHSCGVVTITFGRPHIRAKALVTKVNLLSKFSLLPVDADMEEKAVRRYHSLQPRIATPLSKTSQNTQSFQKTKHTLIETRSQTHKVCD